MGMLRVICIMSSYQTPTPSNVIILVISKNQAQNAFLSKLAFYSFNSYFTVLLNVYYGTWVII